MQQIINTFVGRTEELNQWVNLLTNTNSDGKAVVVIGKYGMGKTWLLDQMVVRAKKIPSLKCLSVRYSIAPGESPSMLLRMMIDDMFQAARHEAGSLDADGKRFVQWNYLYRELGLLHQQSENDFQLLNSLRYDTRKNIYEQFLHRLSLFSNLLPEHGRLFFSLDPELDTPATRVGLWTQVVQHLPPKIVFLFAQRYKDTLTADDEFRSLKNIHFIPPLETSKDAGKETSGLSDLSDAETAQLVDAYKPLLKDRLPKDALLHEVFRRYRNHPYAVHAALDLLLRSGVSQPEQLPQEPMPSAVTPLQWQGVTKHPLAKEAVALFEAYTVLEVPALDEMACWVADISQESLNKILADPFLRSLIRDEMEGRILYHHHLAAYIRSLLYTQQGTMTLEAERLHRRAMIGYGELMQRAMKPDPLATIRLAEHSLAVGGPELFAETLGRSAEAFFDLGFYQNFAALIDRALALVPPESTQAAELFYQLGRLRQNQKDFQAAVKHFDTSLRIAQKVNVPGRVAATLFRLGQIANEQGHFHDAEKWLHNAIIEPEAVGNKTDQVEALVLFGEVLWREGRTKEAEEMLHKAVQTTESVRNYRQRAGTMAAIYTTWGRMFDESGNTERAAEQYHKAIDLTKDIYDREAEAELRTKLGSLFERIGNLKAAEANIIQAMNIHHDLKLIESWAEDNLRMAKIAEMRGKHDQKRDRLYQARQVYQQLGNVLKLQEIDAINSK
jgi:tetratricopeptide (TPR) repeat protein